MRGSRRFENGWIGLVEGIKIGFDDQLRIYVRPWRFGIHGEKLSSLYLFICIKIKTIVKRKLIIIRIICNHKEVVFFLTS